MNSKLIKFINEIPGWLSEKEAIFLSQVAKNSQKYKGDIVEIGSFHGKSTICLAQGKGKVYAIDPHKGYVEANKVFPSSYTKFLKSINEARVNKKIVPLVMKSKTASKTWKRKIRLLFIDGLHDEKNAFQDYELFNNYVIENGIVAVHDSFLRWCGSEKMAMKKIVNSSEYYKIGIVGSIIYGVKGQGTLSDKIIKLALSVAINTLVKLNHLKLTIFNLPEILKTKILPRYNIDL
ncbi:MAG TPA: class I SAM-dependent methyltransferase [Candidatus Limnocylindrales bacterium]|nr:class I SAM-dependent methyltransferase [Candidatus Limnocylindrales bacterium]